MFQTARKDMRSGELCVRYEYGRWQVEASGRSQSNKILLKMILTFSRRYR